VHPRVSVHQVAFLRESTTTFVDHCRTLGVEHLTLVTPLVMRPGGVAEAEQAIAGGGPRVTNLNHPFATFPHLEGDGGEATEKLLQAIEIGAQLGATNVYLLTGGRGSLTWEQAAQRFADLIAPCKASAARAGVTLLIENASAFNADIHIAHTLADTLTLADIAGIGICLELHACWMEAGLQSLIRRAMPVTGLVQVSDYVLGDRSAPCRAVPGDGTIALKRILGDILDAGYQGVFDLELVGPRIEAEGARAATARGALRLSELLTTLGG
jgi:sugar phosphate isomerase/epimerase